MKIINMDRNNEDMVSSIYHLILHQASFQVDSQAKLVLHRNKLSTYFGLLKVLTILSYRMQSSANTSPSKNQNTGISQVNNSPNTQNSYLPSLIDIGQLSQLNSRISNHPSEVSRSSRITSQHSSVINRANERNNEQTERAKAFYRNWVRRDVNQGHGLLFQGGNQLNFPIEMVMRTNPPSQPREGA